MHTIFARLNHPQASEFYQSAYCYDEPAINLYAEPLVHMTTKVIQDALGTKPEEVLLDFTDKADEDFPETAPPFRYSTKLALLKLEADEDGTTYSTKYGPVWLCNHLFDYFDEATEVLYVGINA